VERRRGTACRSLLRCPKLGQPTTRLAGDQRVEPHLDERRLLRNARQFRSALPLDMRHVTHYTTLVIKTFADRHASELFVAGRSSRLPADIVRRARRKLEYIDLASCLEDLHVPPGNRLHKLAGDREGQYAIAINDRWRICFRFVDGDALDVEITDYH